MTSRRRSIQKHLFTIIRPHSMPPKHFPNSPSSSKPARNARDFQSETPEVQMSKFLSKVLRHKAQDFGLSMRSDGYVKVEDVVNTFFILEQRESKMINHKSLLKL
jgi:RNA:NAD 2'-phosphotransferase (TPT1/KptA family)